MLLPYRFNNKNNHIECKSTASKTHALKLLIDTGSEVNMIKINLLKKQTFVIYTSNICLDTIKFVYVPNLGHHALMISL